MDLYLVSSYRMYIDVYNEQDEEVYSGIIENCETEQLDMVIKNIEPVEANTLIITVI